MGYLFRWIYFMEVSTWGAAAGLEGGTPLVSYNYLTNELEQAV